MYLVSLLPDGKKLGVGNCIETSVIGTWQGSVIQDTVPFVQDDYTLVFKAGPDVYTAKASDIPADWTFWIPLLQSPFLVLRPVFLGKVSKNTFHCIRLGLSETPQEYSLKYFKHETILSQILSRVCLFVEGPATLSVKHTIFSTKKKYLEEVYDGVPLAFGSHVDFLLSFVTERKPKPLTFEPIQVLTGHTLSNKKSAAIHLIGAQNALVITEDPEFYTTFPGTVVNKIRISKQDLQTHHLFVLDVKKLPDVLREQDKDLKSFSEILGIATNTSPSEAQVRRFFWNYFWHKQDTSSMSIANIVWPVLLEDSVVTHDKFFYTKKLHLLEHTEFSPRWPTFSEIADIYNERDPQVLKAGFGLWSQYVTNLGLPKALLRKVKLRVIHVRPTLAEQRLSLLKESLESYEYNFLLDIKSHVLTRLAPITLDKSQLLELLLVAFQKKVSFAGLLTKRAFSGSESFVRSQVLESPVCCICQELPDGQRTLGLCGHSFCQECSIQVFGESIRNPKKTTSCPYCREDLACGDLFTIGPKAKSLVFCSKTLALSKHNGLLLDEDRLLGPPGSYGSAISFEDSDKITLVSIQDTNRLIANLLDCAARKPVVKVTALLSPTDTFGEILQQYFG